MSRRVSQLLVEAGAISYDDLGGLMARALTDGQDIVDEEIYRLGTLHERKLCAFLATETGEPVVVISHSTIDTTPLGLIPEIIARQNHLLPVSMTDDVIVLVAESTALGQLLEHVAFASGRTVVVYRGVGEIIDRTVDVAYRARARGDAIIKGAQAVYDAAYLHIEKTSDVADVLNVDEQVPPVPLQPVVTGTVVESAAARTVDPTVLVVEDDIGIRGLLVRAMRHDGYNVVEAETGDAAVQILRTLRPHVVLLDAMLPGVHGFQICAQMKRSEAFRDVAVIMVSAVYRGWEQSREIQETHGADAFVEKPFDVHHLRKLVASFVGRELPRAPLSNELRRQLETLGNAVVDAARTSDEVRVESLLKQWYAIDPFDSLLHLEIGNQRVRRGNLPGALVCYEKAAAFDPRSVGAFIHLATVYERLGFRSKARTTWTRARRLTNDKMLIGRIESHLQF